MSVPLSVDSTDPVGLPPYCGVMAAVKVTGCKYMDPGGLAGSAVRVTVAVALFTCCVIGVEGRLGRKLLSPL